MGRGDLPHVLQALVASASLGTLTASRLSSGAGALSWRLVQDSRGKDGGRHLGVGEPHGGGADVDHPLLLHPLFGPVGVEGSGHPLDRQVLGHPVHEGKLLKFQCVDIGRDKKEYN